MYGTISLKNWGGFSPPSPPFVYTLASVELMKQLLEKDYYYYYYCICSILVLLGMLLLAVVLKKNYLLLLTTVCNGDNVAHDNP